MGRPFKCPYCQSTDNTGKGVRVTKTQGVRRIRRCRGCGRKFTPRNQQPLDGVPNAKSTTPENESTESPSLTGELSGANTPTA